MIARLNLPGYGEDASLVLQPATCEGNVDVLAQRAGRWQKFLVCQVLSAVELVSVDGEIAMET